MKKKKWWNFIKNNACTRKLYAVESPDVRHIDEGRAKLSKGFANVSIDPIFKETIENNYNVYLTPEGKTKALYVAEKTKDYFIVKDTASTNAVFSYIISAYRKGYQSKRFDSGSDIEILAVIDEENKVTDVEIVGEESVVPLPQLPNNSINENTSNLITGNVINEVELQTDLSNILEPASNTTTTETTAEASIVVENSINASGENSTNIQTSETIQQQTEEQTEILEISENKFTINSIDENEIISQIEQKTKLDKEKIKKAIKFKKKEPVKEEVEEIEEEVTTTIVQQAPQLDYISKVNGSIILRLG